MTATVAIAGSSGLIGSALVTALRTADHRVLRIVRRAPANANELHWDPDSGEFDTGALQGVDAVVNLCGINIGQRRWSGAFKQRPARQPHHPDRSAGHRRRRRGRRRARQRQRGRLLRRHQGPRGRRNLLAGKQVSWPSCARTGRRSPRRPATPARAWCWPEPAWCWPHPAVRYASYGRCSRWASEPDWATAASTCRGSASRIRCGRCGSPSTTTGCPGR